MDTAERDDEAIFVTRPSLPPLEEFMPYLEKIWGSKWLTNNGPFHQQFEQALADHLGVSHVSLFANGTLALVTALQALRISGEVITTPFSFVATTHALWWNSIRPVFVDIDPRTCNLDPGCIEAAITPRTTAILPVHVFGNPCAVRRIGEIAAIHGLKVIYDACHTFGETVDGLPVLRFGDLSVLSFHATKVFTTCEGGAIICHDRSTKKHIDNLKNFGFVDETTVVTPGINAKMNEIQAGLGLLQLKFADQAIAARRRISKAYRRGLRGIGGVSTPDPFPGSRHSYPYFPVFIKKSVFKKSRDEVYEGLKRHGVFARRYFFPLISQFPMYRDLASARPGSMPVAERMADEVLCLPIYPDLDLRSVERICCVIRDMAAGG